MTEKDSIPRERKELGGQWRWLAGAVVVLLTLAVVGGLVYHRLSSRSLGAQSVGSVRVSGVDFSCRLPVLAGAAGAFISFPKGAVTIDRSVTLDPYKGGYGYTYDAKVGRWVPVPGSALSPDGRSYAYLAQTTGIPGQMTSMSLHTHEIASGQDRVLWDSSGSPMGPNMVTWLPGGIYFSAVLIPVGSQGNFPFPAVYVSDPSHAGAPRRVGPNPAPQPPSAELPSYSGPDGFNLIGGGAAWAMGNRIPKETPSPNQPPAPGTFGPDRILRMDLRDGSVSTWYTVNGTELVSLMGFDGQGRPILSLFEPKPNIETTPPSTYEPPPAHLLLLTGPSQTIELTSGNPDFYLGSPPMGDSHGIWFGSWNSVWLYTQSGGLHQVATIAAGLFPSPSPPPGFPAKPAVPPSGKPGLPAYMQGTLVMPAGSCA
jgi:hypothetical protein